MVSDSAMANLSDFETLFKILKPNANIQARFVQSIVSANQC